MKRPLLTSFKHIYMMPFLMLGMMCFCLTTLQAQNPPLIDGLPGFECSCDEELPAGFMEVTISFRGDPDRVWFASNCSGVFTVDDPLLPLDTTQIIESPIGSGNYSLTALLRADGDACVYLLYRAPGGEIVQYATLPEMHFNAESCMMQQVEIIGPVNEFCRAVGTYTYTAMHTAANHQYYYDWILKDAMGNTIDSDMSDFPSNMVTANFNTTYDLDRDIDPGLYFLCVEGHRADEPSCYVLNQYPLTVTNGSDNVSLSGDARFCINGTDDVHTYSISGSSFGAADVLWQVKNGTNVMFSQVAGSSIDIDFGGFSSGSFTVCASGTDSNSCIVDAQMDIEIYDPNTGSIEGLEEIVCGMTASYTLNYPEAVTNVTWTSTGGTTPIFDAANPETATVTWDNSGFTGLSISISGETLTGCPFSITKSITLLTNPGNLFGIDGLSTVCENDQEVYCIDFPTADAFPYTYTWELQDLAGNTIPLPLDPTNNNTCQPIDFTGLFGGETYRLIFTATPTGGSSCPTFMNSKLILIQDSTSPSMACISSGLNVSIGNNCKLEVTADLLVEGIDNIDNDAFIVVLKDLTTGETINGSTLGFEHLGHQIEVKIVHKCSGQSCWGTITVEDKSVPVPNCPIATGIQDCEELAEMRNPLFFPILPIGVDSSFLGNKTWLLKEFDNCGDVTLTYEDIVDTDSCEQPYEVNRRWTVTDENGAISFCDVEMLVAFSGTDKVILAPNYDDIIPGALPALQVCGNYPTDENGNPDPSFTGMPTGAACAQIEVLGYTDRHIYICSSGPARKIIREWTIWDVCEETDFVVEQFITLMDTEAPICAALDEFQVFADDHTCQQDVVVPYPDVAGECDGAPLKIQMGYKLRDEIGLVPSTFTYTGIDNNIVDRTFTIRDLKLDSDTIWINYIVEDACGNSTADTGCFTEIEILDITPPSPVCDLNNNISLGPDGCAFAGPGTFDDHSYDNCGVYQVVLNRMDNYETCHSIEDNELDSTTHCPKPNFDYLTFLGIYDGHYYYLSKEKTTGPKAFAYSNAIDAYVADIDSTGENTWVNAQVRNYTNDPYFIGYRTENMTENNINPGNNDFIAQAGGDIDYENWGPGEPDFQFDGHGELYVSVESDGTWHADRQTDINTFYVVEIENPCTFRQTMKFCCKDVHHETMMMVRVIDHFGNFADCMVNVEVQDFYDPTIATSPDAVINLSCDALADSDFEAEEDSEDLLVYGAPTFADNCDLEIDYNVTISGGGQCGSLKIVRRWVATDYSGNSESFSQTINVGGDSTFDEDNIIWPDDHDADTCFDGIEPENLPDSLSFPIFIGANSCAIPTATHTDQIFEYTEEACRKILRHWTVIDWCQEGRQWTHTQVIKVNDNEGPVFNNCEDIPVTEGSTLQGCVFDTWEAGLQANVTDNCDNNLELAVSFDLDYNCDGNVEFEGILGKNANGQHPFGTHCLTFYATDRCGNTTTCSKTFTIEGEDAPTPYCLSEVVTVIPPSQTGSGSGTAVIWAEDFDLGSYDGCSQGSLTFSFSDDITDTNASFTCADIENGIVDTIPLQMWVTDSEGNQAYCPVSLILQDNHDLCLDATGFSREWANLGGRVATENNEMLDQTGITLYSGNSTMDNDMTALGEYAFGEVPMYDDYQITAERNDFHLNGVTTLDLVMIQQHILGLNDLGSPYKIIAADANNSESVTAADIVEIRKLILGIHDEYPNSESWKFADRNYQFDDPSSPWPYAENIQLFQVANDLLALDFIGVKVGDVNGSVSVSLLDNDIEARSSETFKASTKVAYNANGEMHIEVMADGDYELTGAQMSLQLDYGDMTFMSLEAGVLNISDNHYVLNNSARELALSWNSGQTIQIQKGDLLFTVKANAESYHQGELSTTAILSDEVYVQTDEGIEIMEVEFDTDLARLNAGFAVYQNNPNPFNEETTIGFEIPEDDNVFIQILDATGKVLYARTDHYNRGYNEFKLNTNEFAASGLLYYQISTNTNIATRKMIVVK